MKKLLPIFILTLIIPQIAMAAWWNPFSWSIWSFFIPTHNVQQVQIVTTSTSATPATTAEKVDAKVVPPKKLGVVPSQPIPTPSPSCTQDIWSCSDWLACSSSGSQTRSCTKTFDCSSAVTPSPITSQFCTPPAPPCQTDTWSCGNWNTCSASGNQTRICTKTFECPSVSTPSPASSQSCTPPAPIQQTPTYVMPDKPIIESLCDNKGNCVHSQFADTNSNSYLPTKPTIHVGETLSFTIKVSGEETSGVLAFIVPQGYDWVKEGGIKPWVTDLTYTKTFSVDDVSTSGYPIYAYIKSQNDNYHRKSSGCFWINYSCDDSAILTYVVLP